MPIANAFIFILLMPLLASVILVLGRNRLFKKLASLVAILSTLIGLGLILYFKPTQELIQIPWFNLQEKLYFFSILLNNETYFMLVIVHVVAILVQIFSIDYMAHDEGYIRYFAFLQFFIFAMLGVVLAGNLLVMYVFWELVGLASYLLIGFWFQKNAAIKASKKAFIFNRIGDAGFLAGIGLLFYVSKSFDFSADLSTIDPNVATLIGCLLFCGTVAKSAQFPLQVWLPDAMEGPTPVSALIHAATMVAAGVFLLIRIFPILTPDALFVITIVGCITMLLGGFSAIFQSDIKKLLAFSTISQLGLMVLAVGLGSPEGAFFHLMTHAFFKAGLFLGAGAVIHHLHTQNMNEMGGLLKTNKLLAVVYIICALALAGVPMTSGFLSKEIILSVAQTKPVFYGLILFNAMLTSLYMTRQIKLIFWGQPKQEKTEAFVFNRHLPLIILAVASVGFVFSFNPINAEQSWFWSFFKIPQFEHQLLTPILSILVVGIGSFLGLNLEKIKDSKFTDVSVNQFYINELYHEILVKPTFILARFSGLIDKLIDNTIIFIANIQLGVANLIAWFDESVIDKIVDGVSLIIAKIGRITAGWQTKSSVVTMLKGLILIVLVWFLSH